MLKSLFTPKWKHKDPKVRRQAIEQLDSSADSVSLLEIIQSDETLPLRQLALAKLDDSKALQPLLSEAGSPHFWCFIATRIAEINSNHLEALSVQFNARRQIWSNEAIDDAMSQCAHAQLAELILLGGDENSLLKAATSAKSIPLRLKAVAQIDSLESLQQLVKQASHKQVLQACREKIKNKKAEQAEYQQGLASAQKICEVLSRLIKKDWDTQFNAKVSVQKNLWQALDASYQNACLADYDALIKQCDAIAAEKKQALEQAQQVEEAAINQQELCNQLQCLNDEITQENLTGISSLTEAYSLLVKTWQQLAADYPPSAKLKARFSTLNDNLTRYFGAWQQLESLVGDFQHHCNELVKQLAEAGEQVDLKQLSDWRKTWRKLTDKLNWPKDFALPAVYLDWQVVAKDAEQRVNRLEAKQKKAAAHLQHKIRTLQNRIQEKNLISANKLLNYINYEKQQLSGSFLKQIEQRLESIEEKIVELRDWHAFATTPKKQTLVESMSSLVGADIEPLALAENIHQLQEQWHQLVSSDAEADHLLWDQFKEKADQAYQPCLAYYAAQDKVKSDNLSKRITICQDLESQLAKIDFESDELSTEFWKTLDKAYSQVTQEWKKFQPVPANENKRIQNRFNKALGVFKAQLNHYKEENLEARERLIKKAEKLATMDDNYKAIELAKSLQSEWRELGLTFFKADRTAWQTFRKAIDQVFNKRDELKQAFKNELSENKDKLESLTLSINKLTELDDQQLKQSEDEFNALVDEWDQEAELPRNQARQLLKAFDIACDNYRKKYSGIDARQSQKSLANLLEIASLLDQLEAEKIEDKAIDFSSLKSQIETIDGNPKAKTALHARIEQDILSACSASSESLQKIEDLALEMEILLAIDSPEEYKSQRMAKQLAHLEKDFGALNVEQNKSERLLTMIDQWVGIGNIDRTNREKLTERLSTALKVAKLS